MRMRNWITKQQSQRGLTLVELLVVVVILGLLTGIVGVNVFNRLKKARVAAAKTQIYNLSQALDSFRIDNGFYPTTEQGLDALIEKPTFGGRLPKSYPSGGYLKQKNLPLDPWSEQYNFVSPGVNNPDSFDLWSNGEDAEEGTEDDINNWDDTSGGDEV